MPNTPVFPSTRLNDIRYEIRGSLATRALALEAQGRSIVKLNIGNPGLFGFRTPEHLRSALAENLDRSEAYCHQQGLEAPRIAIAAQQKARGVADASPERVFIGNGVSELIDIALRALLNSGDEVLLPSPDYPLWSAATLLNGGVPIYYDCTPQNAHMPDPQQIEALITPRTRALVLINPNNPTGAVYPRALLEQLVAIAARHRLVLLADEIYDSIVYDDAEFTALAPLAGDVPTLSFAGLSKVHRACGYRIGWLSLSGAAPRIRALHQALDLLAALRLCANVAGQWAIAPALTGPDTISSLTAAGGRLHEARLAVMDAVAESRFLEVVAPQGALYAFPQVKAEHLAEFDDEAFALELLETENVLLVPGSSFNIDSRRHFRVTLLPEAPVLTEVFARIERTLQRMAARAKPARHVA